MLPVPASTYHSDMQSSTSHLHLPTCPVHFLCPTFYFPRPFLTLPSHFRFSLPLLSSTNLFHFSLLLLTSFFHCPLSLPLFTSTFTSISHFQFLFPLHTSTSHFHFTLPHSRTTSYFTIQLRLIPCVLDLHWFFADPDPGKNLKSDTDPDPVLRSRSPHI
jgi:hypothetical protein